MSDINIQMQDSTGNNVYPQTKAKIVKIGSTDAETMLNELEGREEVFVEVTEPTKDGLWIDTSDSEYGGSESQLATQVKTYVDGKLDPVINEVQTARNGETDLDTRLDKIDKIEAYQSEVTTSNEINVISEVVQKQIKVTNVQGKTCFNLFGNDGDCESLDRWIPQASGTVTLDSTNKTFGNYGMKITNASNASWSGIYKDVSNIIDKTKYYCLSAYVKNGNCVIGINVLTANSSSAQINGSSAISATDKFYRVFIKLKPSDLTNVKYMGISTNNNGVSSAVYAYVDGMMLEEITSTQYNDSAFVPSPYINGDLSVGESLTRIKTRGKNMLLLEQGTIDGTGKAIASNVRLHHKYGTMPVKPNTTYTLSSDKPIFMTVPEWDINRYRAIVNPWDSSMVTTLTFTTSATTRYITPLFKIDDTNIIYAEDFKIQLEEGSVATTYEPYKETLVNVNVPLRSLPDGTKDTVENGKLIKRIDKVILDGNLYATCIVSDSTLDYKVVMIYANLNSVTVRHPYLYKHNNMLLGGTEQGGVIKWYGGDTAQIYDQGVQIAILNSDSGWNKTYTPTPDEVKAYFYGWKMYDNVSPVNLYSSGTKAWVRTKAMSNGIYNDGGIASTTNTLPTSLSSGHTPYKLYYKLNNPIITELSISNLTTFNPCSLVIESDSQGFIRPTITYKISDTTKTNINDLECGLSDIKRLLQSSKDDIINSVNQISNPNLLINGDFKNPVNQRGLTSWTNNQWWFAIDRWRIRENNAGKIELTSSGLTMSGGACNIGNTLEVGSIKNGTIVTLSAKVNGVIEKITGVWDNTDTSGWNQYGHIVFWHGAVILYCNPSAGDTVVNFEWIKLELGNIATPFVPRPYAEELMLCQRYYRILHAGNIRGEFFGANACRMCADLYPPMRVPPSSTLPSPGATVIESIGTGNKTGGTCAVNVNTTQSFHFDVTGLTSAVQYQQAVATFNVPLDSEIYS